jgi:xylulokinase
MLPLTEVRVVGGGERSGLWNQIKADTLGSRVVQINRGEGAPLGTALLAAYGVGLLKDMNKALGRWIGIGKVTRPNRGLSCYYQRRLSRYVALLEALHGWSEK